jgi:UDP-N-acetylmuramate dehydrogenase
LNLRENVPLGPLTTLQVGGPARYLVDAASPDDVREAVAFSKEGKLPLFILGGGSNLVVSDAGWPGLVLRIAIQSLVELSAGLYEVGAGYDWDRFVAYAVGRNCAGIECLSGIPGTVGGTPIQNVGAYGQEVSTTIHSVHCFDRETSAFHDFSNAECGFGYRASNFNRDPTARFIVLRVTYQLNPGGTPLLEYADLKRYFGDRVSPTLIEVRDAVREIRGRKGMLLDDSDMDSRSAGSFFKNPIVAQEYSERLAAEHDMPKWWAGLNRIKLSAAWLVEHSGFPKGYTRGTVGISTKHALAIVNRGGATAQDVVDLRDDIVARVEERFGVALLTEPVFLGEFTTKSRATRP